MHKVNCMQSIEHISTWEVFSSICPQIEMSTGVSLLRTAQSLLTGRTILTTKMR